MTITSTPRLGLTQWSAGSDSVNHEQFNSDFANLEALVPVYGQGVFASRPTVGVPGRFYFATDTQILYYDTGTAWVIPSSPIITVIPHTWALSGEFFATAGADSYLPPFFVSAPSGQTVTLVNVRAVCRSGSCTVSLAAAGTPITGLTAMAVSTTPTTFTPTSAVTLSDGELLGPTIAAVVSTPDGLTITAGLSYSLNI
jgi:hypothetical protein